ncbi:hypothetical protein FRB90_001042 [Tulasnella sp. 427]|nr:hypothetical protein FRB90_001042 [Tulasnella sp. 427]
MQATPLTSKLEDTASLPYIQNHTPSTNTKALNLDWYGNNQTSSSSTDLHFTTTEEEDPLGLFTQAVRGYFNKVPQDISPQPIPQDWEQYFVHYNSYNHLIEHKGDLKLDLYRNYHGEDFWWNNTTLNIKDVVINNQEHSIKFYLQEYQDLDLRL